MALINPVTGSSKFNAVIRRNGIISLAGEIPVVLSEEEEFGIKLLADALTGEEISHKDLKEVPAEEIGEDGIWIHAEAAKLKTMSQEELIAMVLELQGKGTAVVTAPTEEADAPVAEPEAETAEEPAEEEEVVEKPKRKRKKKVVEPVEEEEVDVEF